MGLAVKLKLKNLVVLLQSQAWTVVEDKDDVAICEFTYTTKGWGKHRILKTNRTVKEYKQISYLRQKQIVPVYQYAC